MAVPIKPSKPSAMELLKLLSAGVVTANEVRASASMPALPVPVINPNPNAAGSYHTFGEAVDIVVDAPTVPYTIASASSYPTHFVPYYPNAPNVSVHMYHSPTVTAAQAQLDDVDFKNEVQIEMMKLAFDKWMKQHPEWSPKWAERVEPVKEEQVVAVVELCSDRRIIIE